MTFVIRHNTDTGSLAIYADKAAAGDAMPVFASVDELANTKASIAELARFYNQMTGQSVKTFKDRSTAVRRVWSAAEAKVAGEHLPDPTTTEEQQGEEPIAPAPAEEVAEPTQLTKRRGRKPGSGKFAGKVVFAKCKKNPRRNGVKGWLSYEIILGKEHGVLYDDYVAKGGRAKDLQWDIDRGWAEVK